MDKVQIQNTNAEIKENQQLILKHWRNGMQEMNIFLSNLLDKRHAGLTEREIIDDILTPSIISATGAFGNIKDSAEKLLCNINVSLEYSVLQCKELSDKEKQLNETKKQLGKKLEQKQQGLNDAEDNLRQKKRVLAEAKDTLEENEAELRERIETRSNVNKYGNIASIVVGWFNPVLGLTGYLAKKAVDVNVLRKNVEDQRKITELCADEISSCKSRIKIAEKEKQASLKELSLINDKLNDTNNKLQQCQGEEKSLIKLQENIIDFNERFKMCFHLLKKLFGRSEVLHREVAGGYLLNMFTEPTKDLYESFLALSKCTGFRHIFGDTTFEIEAKYNKLKLSLIKASK